VLLRDTALALKRRGHEPHLVVYGYGLGEDASDLPVHRCWRVPGARKTAAGPAWSKPVLDLALALTLRRVVTEQRVDIVHAHNYEGLMVALAVGARPIVYHAHNALVDELPHYFGGASWAERMGAKLDRELPRRADHVIAPHRRLAEYLELCGCARERTSVIAPCMAPWPETPAPECDATPVVVYAGNLDAYQNLPFLVEVMERVRQVKPEARFRVVTGQTGTLRGAEMVRAPVFDALRTELARDCVVACPRVSWSGYPIKLLNAMAAGKAIVACSGSAYPLESEKSGLVVPDNDVEAFAVAVVQALDDPALRARLGANAREALLRHHDPDEIAQAIEGVYVRLLGRA
jgi:glycosyltransferase involved in cell wall biosynthesis